MQQLAILIDFKEDIFDSESTIKMIEYLKELIPPQVPANYRRLAFAYLSKFSGLPKVVLVDLVPLLVGYAKSEGEPTVRAAIEDSILNLRRGNLPRDMEIWVDAYGYHQFLLTRQEDSEKQRGSSFRQRMAQITREARKKEPTAGNTKK